MLGRLPGGVAQSAALVAVDDCCLSTLAIGGQQTPEMALGNAKNRGCLDGHSLARLDAFKDVNLGALLLIQ